MKINYYEAFDLIADEAVELLADYDRISEQCQSIILENTLKDVLGSIENNQKIRKKKTNIKIRFLIAAIIVLAMSSMVFALKSGGAVLITELNRHLVGKNILVEATVWDKEGNWVSGPRYSESNLEGELASCSTIKTAENMEMVPYHIDEFIVRENGDIYTTPEIMFANGDMVIFTKEDGSGWNLKKDETLCLNLEQYLNEEDSSHKGYGIGYTYILEGKLMNSEIEVVSGLEQSYCITADVAGEYYIAYMNLSAERISLKEGKIYVK